MPVVNIHEALSNLTDYWSPVTVAEINDYDVRVVRVKGEFPRHSHPETDEFFLVLSGELTIRTAQGPVTLGAGDSYVVGRGEEHQPVAEAEASVLLFEPSQTVNTGDRPGEFTRDRRSFRPPPG